MKKKVIEKMEDQTRKEHLVDGKLIELVFDQILTVLRVAMFHYPVI